MLLMHARSAAFWFAPAIAAARRARARRLARTLGARDDRGARCVRSSDGRRALAAAPGRIRVITRARSCRMTYGRPSKVGGAVPLGAAAALLCCSAAATASAGGAQCTIIEG